MPTFTANHAVDDYKTTSRLVELEFAGPDELIEFANKVREAGGANPLEALLPSTPSDPGACLIANALNFDCEIEGYDQALRGPGDPVQNEAAYQWCMVVANETLAVKIAAALEMPLIEPTCPAAPWMILLPERIGNAAAAFDSGAPEFKDWNLDLQED